MRFAAAFAYGLVGMSTLAPALCSAETAQAGALAPVQALSTALIDAMKSGAKTSHAERAERLAPIVDRSFELALTTRVIVGQKWSSIPVSDQNALQAAIRKMTIAEYAHNFAHWSGESIVVDPKVDVRGGDALVKSSLMRPKADPVILAYRLRQSGGQWRIMDVLYNGTISQLATRRADYAHILETNGVRALIEHIDALAANTAR